MNYSIFLFFNSLAIKFQFIDFIFIFLAKFSFLIFIIYYLSLFWRKNSIRRKIAWYGLYPIGFSIVFSWVLNLFYFHPRPFSNHLVTQLIGSSLSGSFPITNILLIFVISFIFFFYGYLRDSIFLFLLGLLGGISQIICGVHYPYDFLGSLIFSFVISFFYFLNRKNIS